MDVKVDTSVKLIVAFTPELKNTHGTVNLKSLNTSHASCEHFQQYQHIKSILELYPDD